MSQSPTLSRRISGDPDDRPILRLSSKVQNYSFGKKGSRSLAARYALVNEREGNFRIDEEQTYGEIWMGDHQDGPSQSLATSTHLRTLIQQSPGAYLTRGIVEKFPGLDQEPQLPFLFKVLSLDKALPLQAHPDKRLIEWLQANQGIKDKNARYIDQNRKPEVAIALSPTFESFIGFRPVEEIRAFIRDVPELRDILGFENLEMGSVDESELEQYLKGTYGQILTKDKNQVHEAAKSLLKRIQFEGDKALGEIGEKEGLGYVVQKVWQQYPGDPGVFAAVFFMNYLVLKRGQAVAVPTNCVHAYLEGDVIECTANSDKIPDREFQGDFGPSDGSELFVKMLLDNSGSSIHQILPQIPFDRSRNSHTTKYETPTEEFSLLKISLDRSEEEFIFIDGPGIYVVTAGEVEVSARTRPTSFQRLSLDSNERGTPGPTEAVASEGGPIRIIRRGSECAKTGEDGQREWLKEGMAVFVKPGYEIGFWNRGSGQAEIHAAYCEADDPAR